MKTKDNSQFPVNLKLLMIIPLIIIIVIALTSCAAKKKISAVHTEIAPPPPPPPPALNSSDDNEPFVVVEEMPVFQGGDLELLKYIAENTKYPENAKKNNIQGRVIVRFCVTSKGNVNRVTVIKGVDPDLDAESVRVVSTLPSFKPGRQGGKDVPVWYMVPITFALNNDSNRYPPRYEVNGNDTVYYETEERPQFPGGKDALMKFKTENINYPPVIKNLGIEGIVSVSFLIEKNGSISNIRITQGVSSSLDAEALRLTKLMPSWLPGKVAGKPVITMFGTNFEFLLNPKKLTTYQDGSNIEVVEDKDLIDSDIPFVVVEEMPIFPGGDSALLAYIANNTKYPESAKINNIQGRIIVRFCVTKEGGVDRVSILKGVNPELDLEALRVVKTLPVFKPGKQGGKPVNVWYMVPITFALEIKAADSVSNQTTAPKPLKAGYDEPPVFKGGEEAMYKFIDSNIVYPKSVRENKISGKVILSFCVNTDGSLNPITVYKSVDPELDKEALRVVGLLPAWKPGKLEGTPVRVWYFLPLKFTLK